MLFKSCNEFIQSIYNYSTSTSSLSRLKNLDLLSYLSVLGVSLMLLSTLVLLLFHKHKLKIMSFFNSYYARLYINELNENGNLFDCFISHCPEDKEAVDAILEALEKKPPYYSFCTRERNWAPMSYIPTNIFLSVQNSRKTLMILSEAFLRTPWFHLQFQVAFHQVLQGRGHRLILILKDLPPKTQLPADIQYFLDTRSCLKWGDTWFWERLKNSIEDGEGLIDSRHRRSLQNTINNEMNNNQSVRDLFKGEVI